VIPYLDAIGIDDEDSVSLEDKPEAPAEGAVKIAVIQVPKISNFTDFACLAGEQDVSLYYVKDAASLGNPDLIMLPGSKNTTADMLFLRENGLEKAIKERAAAGTPLIGICGGYQMLGEAILDPLHTESSGDGIKGFGLLGLKTVFEASKLTRQVRAECHAFALPGPDNYCSRPQRL
jgi:adenosylcobyric acid synthase